MTLGVLALILALGVVLGGCATAQGRAARRARRRRFAGAVAVIDPETGAERGTADPGQHRGQPRRRPVRPRPLTRDYDALLAAMPPPPQVFTLYFVEGTTELAPKSVATLEQLRGIVTPTSDVQITGHTDTTGDPASNDKLSLARAIEVRAALVQDGLPVGNARVTGRGSGIARADRPRRERTGQPPRRGDHPVGRGPGEADRETW